MICQVSTQCRVNLMFFFPGICIQMKLLKALFIFIFLRHLKYLFYFHILFLIRARCFYGILELVGDWSANEWYSNFLEIQVSSPWIFCFLHFCISFYCCCCCPKTLIKMLFLTNKSSLIIFCRIDNSRQK